MGGLEMSKDKKGSKGKRQPIPIACPDLDSAKVEGLIDLLVIKGVINDQELAAAADLYVSYMNGLLDLLHEKGIIEEWELDIAVAEFHRFVQAIGQNNFIPPAVLFERRRNAVSDRLKLERKLRAGESSQPATSTTPVVET
jgi:hypothetical protein